MKMRIPMEFDKETKNTLRFKDKYDTTDSPFTVYIQKSILEQLCYSDYEDIHITIETECDE